MSLEELAVRAITGDAAAIENLLGRYLPSLRAFVRLRAGPVVAARESNSDLVQSVCREVLQAGNFEYRGEAAFKSWLFTTALRKIIEKDRHYRTEKRDAGREVALRQTSGSDQSVAPVYASFLTPSHDVAMKEQLARVEAAFAELTEEHREAITLARIVGLPHAEIAKLTGRTEEGSRAILRRALVRLSELLACE